MAINAADQLRAKITNRLIWAEQQAARADRANNPVDRQRFIDSANNQRAYAERYTQQLNDLEKAPAMATAAVKFILGFEYVTKTVTVPDQADRATIAAALTKIVGRDVFPGDIETITWN